jgi:hypothetical protein
MPMKFTKAEKAALPPLGALWGAAKAQWVSPCCKTYLAHSPDGVNLIFRHFVQNRKTKIISKPLKGLRNWRNHQEHKSIRGKIEKNCVPDDRPHAQIAMQAFLTRGKVGEYQDASKDSCLGLLKNHLPVIVICPQCSRRVIITNVKGTQ